MHQRLACAFSALTRPIAALVLVVLPMGAAAVSADDNVKCYSVVAPRGATKFVPVSVTLIDGIEDKLSVVQKPGRVCNRAEVASEGIADPVASWTCYPIKQAKGEAKFVRRDIHVRDRFGVHTYALSKASQLCVISERDRGGVPAPSDERKCYKVGNAKGAAKFAGTQTGIADDLDGTKLTIVQKPSMVCDPVDRAGLGIIDPTEHWMCYQIGNAKTVPRQPKFTPRDAVVANPLETGSGRLLTVKKPTELCVPAAAHLAGEHGVSGPQFCLTTSECGAGFYCAPPGVCAPAGAGALGAPCTSGGDCQKGAYCDLQGAPGACAAAGAGTQGGACVSSADCLAGLVCGPAGTCEPPAEAFPHYPGVSCATDDSVFRVFFEVPRPGPPLADFFRLPFPNDARLRANHTLDLGDFPRPGPSLIGVDLVDLYADALDAEFRGFSGVPIVTFRFSRALDVGSLGAAGENIHYVDITPAAPEYASERTHAYDYRTARGRLICQSSLAVRNTRGDPLLPGHTYAVYLTSLIRAVDGQVPTQDPDFAALLTGAPPADVDLAPAWSKYQPLRDYLAGEGIAPATIAGATVFTVQDATGPMDALSAALGTAPLPALSNLTLCDGAAVSPCDDGGERTCGAPDPAFYEIHGRFSVPVYQQGTSPYALSADGGGIAFDSFGVPVQQGTAEICFALTVPKSVSPPGGWPLVVHAHGTGGSFKSAIVNGIASTLATATPPMATFTFDGVAHGERRGASTRDPESLVFNVVNPRAARDNHLQGAVDVTQAWRMAQLPSFAVGSVVVSFDVSRVYFFGHSQGSNVGISALSATDLASAAVLSGPSAVFSEALIARTSPISTRTVLEDVLHERVTVDHPLLTLMQTYVDPGDPINQAPRVIRRPPVGTASKHVFMTWSANDTYAPTAAITDLTRALGLRVAQPVLADFGTPTVARPVSGNVLGGDGSLRTAALFQYVPDGPYDGHFVALRNGEAVSDWRAFLTSVAATGTPVVP